MFIIYNQDGSVKSIKLTDFIQKGNNNVNSIFLAIEGKDNDEWAANIIFALPEGTKVPLTPIATTKSIFEKLYKGWEITLPASVTIYEGIVNFSIAILNLQNETLFTFRGKLTINPSIIVPDVTAITYAQYQSLLQYIVSVIGEPEVHHLYRHTIHILADSAEFEYDLVTYSSSGEEVNTLEKLQALLGTTNGCRIIASIYYDGEYGLAYNSQIVDGKLRTLDVYSAGNWQTNDHTINQVTDIVESV